MKKFFLYLATVVLSVSLFMAYIGAAGVSVSDAGLGEDTQGFQKAYTVEPVFFSDAGDLRAAWRASTDRKAVFWLGASQTYAINAPEPGDRTAPDIAAEAVRKRGDRLYALSYPNGSPAEHYVLLNGVLAMGTPAAVVIGAVYDDMREKGVRPEIGAFAKDGDAHRTLLDTEIGKRLWASAEEGLRATPSQSGTGAKSRSLMDMSEAGITSYLERQFHAETLRGEGRGQIVIAVTKARQFLEGLRARYTRDISNYRYPILADDYVRNWKSWEAMLDLLARNRVPTLIYIAPRPTDFFPYDPARYATFKQDLGRLAEAHGAKVVNLEDVAPSEDFGFVDTNFGFLVRDPFHFKGAAHRKFAAAIERALLPMLGEGASR